MSARDRRSKRSTTPSLDEHYSELSASLHAQWQYGESHRVSAFGGATGGATLGQCGSDHSLTTALELLKTLPDTRERAHQELTLHLTLGAPLQPPEVFPHQKWGYLCPRPGAVPTGRGDPPALPGPLWAADVSSGAGRVLQRASWGSNSWAWPSGSTTRPCLWRPIGRWAAPYSIWVSSALPRRTWRRA